MSGDTVRGDAKLVLDRLNQAEDIEEALRLVFEAGRLSAQMDEVNAQGLLEDAVESAYQAVAVYAGRP